MSITDIGVKSDRADRPLTRIEVEQLLDDMGPNKILDLRHQNLKGINLKDLDLSRANLNYANVTNADLTNTNLSYANLNGTDLKGSNLTNANLSYATLNNATLVRAILRGAILKGASLINADLSYVDLSDADLTYAGINISNQIGIIVTGTTFGNSALESVPRTPNSPILTLRVNEDPLTAYNLNNVLSILTEIHAKFWLIQHKDFAGLIDYAQTHNIEYVKNANLVIKRITYNSPAILDFIVGNMPTIIDAMKSTITLAQGPAHIKSATLDNKTKELDMSLKEKTLLSDLADKKQARIIEAEKAKLENEKIKLEIKAKELEIQEKQLEFEKKRIEIALQIAEKAVDTLSPDADAATKSMIVRTLLPNILQLGNTTGLELIPQNTSKK